MNETTHISFSGEDVKNILIAELEKRGIKVSSLNFHHKSGEGGFGTHFDGATVIVNGRGVPWTALTDGELKKVSYSPFETQLWCSPDDKCCFRSEFVDGPAAQRLTAEGYKLRTFKEVSK